MLFTSTHFVLVSIFFFSSFSSFFPFSVCLCVLCALCNVYVCVSTLNGAKNHAGKHEQVPNIQSARNGTDGDRKVLSKWRTEPISACVLLWQLQDRQTACHSGIRSMWDSRMVYICVLYVRQTNKQQKNICEVLWRRWMEVTHRSVRRSVRSSLVEYVRREYIEKKTACGTGRWICWHPCAPAMARFAAAIAIAAAAVCVWLRTPKPAPTNRVAEALRMVLPGPSAFYAA